MGFARDIVGVEVWHRQAEILLAVRDHWNTAVRSGQKCGKSTSVVLLALWFVCTRQRARVVLTSSTDDQVRNVLWKELTRLYTPRAATIGGDLALDHRTGLRFQDGREIIGIATKKPENMAGLSSPEMLLIADEASGIEPRIFEAIEGNRAGGAKLVMISNPTQTSGKFFDAFHEQREFWHRIHISSEEAAEQKIPGLATLDYVAERKRQWPIESAIYQVRVLGNFPTQSDQAVLSLALLDSAATAWDGAPGDGRLHLGVDVARFGDDDTVICPRRGKRAGAMTIVRKLDTIAVAGTVLQIARSLRLSPAEIPLVKVDTCGIGGGVADALRSMAPRELEIVDVNSASSADDDETYANLRAQLAFGVKTWLAEGGAFPPDPRLEAELLAPVYDFDSRGRMRIESKDDIKERLNPRRSPDRADALALAIYGKARPPEYRAPRAAVVDFDSAEIG